MMCSYYSKNELERAKRVEDKELNDLLQEVRAIDDRYYLLERTRAVKRGWFKKPVEKNEYTVLYRISGTECQIINGATSKSYIHALFYGFLNGYKRGLKG